MIGLVQKMREGEGVPLPELVITTHQFGGDHGGDPICTAGCEPDGSHSENRADHI